MNQEELKHLAEQIADKIIFCSKEVLTIDEVSKYMGLKKSTLYRLTMNREIPCYKPTGRTVYFNRRELEEWLQSNRASTGAELNQQATTYCMKKGGAI